MDLRLDSYFAVAHLDVELDIQGGNFGLGSCIGRLLAPQLVLAEGGHCSASPGPYIAVAADFGSFVGLKGRSWAGVLLLG